MKKLMTAILATTLSLSLCAGVCISDANAANKSAKHSSTKKHTAKKSTTKKTTHKKTGTSHKKAASTTPAAQ